jgi:hypothetical protein
VGTSSLLHPEPPSYALLATSPLAALKTCIAQDFDHTQNSSAKKTQNASPATVEAIWYQNHSFQLGRIPQCLSPTVTYPCTVCDSLKSSKKKFTKWRIQTAITMICARRVKFSCEQKSSQILVKSIWDWQERMLH